MASNRFNLRTLLVSVTAVAVACASLFALPAFVAAPVLAVLALALPAALTAGLVYGGPRQRGLCLGALFPAGLQLVVVAMFLAVFFIDNSWQRIDSPASLEELFYELAVPLRVSSATTWSLAVMIGTVTEFIRIGAGTEGDRSATLPVAPRANSEEP